MFDVTERTTYQNVANWFEDLTTSCSPTMPIVLVGNKVFSSQPALKAKQMDFHRKKNLPYFDISVRASYNIEDPFLWLARRFLQQSAASVSTPSEGYTHEDRARPAASATSVDEAMQLLEQLKLHGQIPSESVAAIMQLYEIDHDAAEVMESANQLAALLASGSLSAAEPEANSRA